jgi:hypothetical protein
VIWCRPNPLSQPHINNEAKLSVWYTNRRVLSLQQHLQHGNHIARHLSAMIPAAPPGFLHPAGDRIRRLRDTNYACSDSTSIAVNKTVKLNGNGHTFDVDCRESTHFSQSHCTQAECILVSLK